ncbi:MAG: flagellar biosynthesis anti-sigma factor FlgM [Bryobacteraceae bacterium]
MKINDTTSAGVSAGKLGEAQAAATARGGRNQGSTVNGGSGDQVQLSNLASTVRSLATDSPDRAARVTQLEQAVQSGRYQVNSMDLSSSMVNAALGGF